MTNVEYSKNLNLTAMALLSNGRKVEKSEIAGGVCALEIFHKPGGGFWNT